MKLYELANPSDQYTFYAPSIEVAGVAVSLLSTAFGAEPVDGKGESTPILFGWEEWFEQKGINSVWIECNRLAIADALDSFLIGSANMRADVESMLEMLPDDKKKEWQEQRQDRHRSSISQIGEAAYAKAAALRKQVTN